MRQIFKAIGLLSALYLTACNNQAFKFVDVSDACTPPTTSARFGKSLGPVITSPAAGDPFKSRMTVSGTCAAGFPLTVGGTGSTSTVDTMCANGMFSVDVTLEGLDGKKQISVSQPTDAADPIVDRLCFNKDTVPPAVVIGGKSINGQQAIFSTTIINLVGTCESGLPVSISGPQLIHSVTTTCSKGHFEAPIEFTGSDGLKDVVAVQTDRAGNSGQDDDQYLTDTSDPIVTISSPAAMSVSTGTITISGQCETGLDVSVQGNAIQSIFSCVGGSYIGSLTLTGPDGVRHISAIQTDKAGNIGQGTRDFVRDTTPPSIKIVSPAANSLSRGSIALAGTCETGLAVHLSGSGLSSQINATCTAGNFSANLNLTSPDGAKEIIATQTDVVGNSGSDRRSFIRDGDAPVITITSPAANSVWPSALTLQGACETGLPVQITGAGASAAQTVSCTNSAYSAFVTLSNGDGNKSITATQTDAAGNAGQASRIFVRDSSAPAIAITSPANGAYVTATGTIKGTCETGLNVVLSGAGLSSSVTVACSSGAFSSSVTFSNGDGAKTIVASQTDNVGNASSDSKTYTRDTTAPTVAITLPAANSVQLASAQVQGTCETGFDVVLAGSGASSSLAVPCSSGAFTGLVNFTNGDGNKLITATQIDAAGNSGNNSRTFIRDTSAPIVHITSPATMAASQTGITLQGTCEAGLNVQISGAGISSSTTTACIAGGFTAALAFSNGDGTKNIQVQQTDSIGNIGTDARDFVRDTVVPTVAISSPAANAYVSTSGTITGTCETGITVNLLGTGLSASVNANCIAGTFSTSVSYSSGDGTKNVIASQTDAAGNIGQANRSFVKDGTSPAIQITSPAANTTAVSGLTLSGTCEAGLTVTISGAGVSSASTTACPSGTFSATISFSNGDGSKVVQVTQTDTAGNIGTDSSNFQRDSSAPAISINTPAANTRAQTGVAVTGTCETGLDVVLSGTGVQTPVTATCTVGAYSSAIVFTAGEGDKNITATQTDSVGNTASASRTFIRDNTTPTVTITSPTANSNVSSSGTITGTCEAGGSAVVISGSGVQSSVNATCTNGAFSTTVNFSSGDGIKTVTAAQNDSAGNTGSTTISYVRDSTAPAVAITSPAAASLVQNTVTISGTCEAGLSVTISGAGVSSASTTTCPSGTFTTALTLSSGDGSKTIVASQTDSAGNTGSATRAFTKDTTAPAIAITSPAPLTVKATGLTVAGTCETGLSVSIDGSGLLTPATTTCSSGTFSAAILFTAGDGNKTITASQTDASNNTGTNSRDFVRDSTAPTIAITSPADGSVAANGMAVSGTCESGLTVVVSGNVTNTSTNCVSGAFSVNVSFTGAIGTKTVMASQTDAAGNAGSDSRSFLLNNSSGFDVFTSKGAGGKVDILFVDDNSASMDSEQLALGSKFSAFASSLTGVDWQAGIITTDCTAGSPYNFCGQLLNLVGLTGEYILNALTPNYLTVFKNTIQRPETIDCLLTNSCPSGREEGLKSAMTAMSLRTTDNNGFFRDGADLAVVILSDEDEQSNAPATATTPAAVISAFNNTWNGEKRLFGYGIIIKPGDTTCLATQKTQLGNNGYYGTYPEQFANLTGGLSVSICATDYSLTLAQIAQNVKTLNTSIDLSHTPLAGTVSINFVPAYSTTWTLTGSRISFTNPAPVGTRIEVSYEY